MGNDVRPDFPTAHVVALGLSRVFVLNDVMPRSESGAETEFVVLLQLKAAITSS